MIDDLVCVIPSFGMVGLTRDVVAALLPEAPAHRVLVVDNGGDYRAAGGETVLTPGTNLGWLRGCNAGLAAAFADPGVHGVVLLNNDVTLSRGFLGGLRDAWAATGAGIVAPCYDDAFRSQSRYWVGAAARFPAQRRELPAVLVDGTGFLVSRTCHDRIGPLDEAGFARHGWGAIADYCARARAVGERIVVTRRSYLSHARGVTARAVNARYDEEAAAEMAAALTERYGPGWLRELGYAVDGPGLGRFRDRVFHTRRRVRARLPGHR